MTGFLYGSCVGTLLVAGPAIAWGHPDKGFGIYLLIVGVVGAVEIVVRLAYHAGRRAR